MLGDNTFLTVFNASWNPQNVPLSPASIETT